MNVKKINNVSFGGIYRIPYTKQNLFELKNFVLPEYAKISKEPVFIFSGNNPFKIAFKKLMEFIAEKNNSSLDWLKMNAQNHGIDIPEDDDFLHVFTTQRDINNLLEYMNQRIETRKPKFIDKVKDIFKIVEVEEYDKDLPSHLFLLTEFLKRDKQEAEAFAKYPQKIRKLNDSKELFLALMSEH